MNFRHCPYILASLLTLAAAYPARGDVIVFDSLQNVPLATYYLPNDTFPVFGDALQLTEPGILTTLGVVIFNGGGGPIVTGNLQVLIFDNTIPYAGGEITNPQLGSGSIDYDFSLFGGLPTGGYHAQLFDFRPRNIHLTRDILIIQQFVETSGTSTANGVLIMPDPIIGQSLQTVFIGSDAISPGLYTFFNLPGQFGYYIAVEPDPVPEPASALVLAAGGVAASLLTRRRRRAR